MCIEYRNAETPACNLRVLVWKGATTHPQIAEVAWVVLWLLIGEGRHRRQLILIAATVSVVKMMLALYNTKKHDGT